MSFHAHSQGQHKVFKLCRRLALKRMLRLSSIQYSILNNWRLYCDSRTICVYAFVHVFVHKFDTTATVTNNWLGKKMTRNKLLNTAKVLSHVVTYSSDVWIHCSALGNNRCRKLPLERANYRWLVATRVVIVEVTLDVSKTFWNNNIENEQHACPACVGKHT